MEGRWLSSGELAREAGVKTETLRYYERTGLLGRPARTASGHRRYGPEAASVLRIIRRAQELGFLLAEIRELLRGLERPSAVCDDICWVIDRKIGRVDQELESLRSLRGRLSRLRAACPRTQPLRECPLVVELKSPGTNPRR